MCNLIPIYIRVGIHVIPHIPPTVAEDNTLEIFGCTSLKSNIPHILGLEAIERCVEDHRQRITEHFKTDIIIKVRCQVIEENTFVFDKEIYRQLQA